jgi:NAD(P)-dependent dehydrogenase (short-subunit alcohol dehydrogenase family)
LQVVEECAAELNGLGKGKCIPLEASLGSKQNALDLAARITEMEPVIHLLFNNAGMSWGNRLVEFNEQNGWDRLFALNVKTLFYLSVA